jgi:arylformamidase
VRAIDLTHPLWDEMMVFPGLPQPSFRSVANVPDDGYSMSEYTLRNHIGTHIDAPAHMEADGVTLDEIPIERLVTDAVTIDVSGRVPGPISLAELEPLAHDVRAGDFVLFYSDNGRNYGKEAYNSGWAYPGPDACRLLIERGVSGVGFDGPSADPVDSETHELHHLWLGAGRLILENLTNLGELPPRTPIVIAPMKVRESNGAPARVFALVD